MQSMMHDYECKETRISKEFTLKEKFLANIWMENTRFIDYRKKITTIMFFWSIAHTNDK